MNLRDLSPYVLCCDWIHGGRQSHFSSKVSACNNVFTTERDNGLPKCRTYISGKSVFKMGHIIKSRLKQESTEAIGFHLQSFPSND